jgi:hypothetical protein
LALVTLVFTRVNFISAVSKSIACLLYVSAIAADYSSNAVRAIAKYGLYCALTIKLNTDHRGPDITPSTKLKNSSLTIRYIHC